MTQTTETLQFQTEARQLLDLMVHSVYSHKEIFLRELISNASDALDKLRYEAVTNAELARHTEDLHIRIDHDSKARTLTIADNGIGMTRDEIVQFIGTIAKSGTREYLHALKEARNANLPPELIGQFGVGFYSSFMVADKVTLVTRRAGHDLAWKWQSEGAGTFTLEQDQRPEPGTTITLHLKPADEEDGLEDYTLDHVIRKIVRKYSDFVTYPIRMRVEKTEYDRDAEGKIKEGAEPRKTIEDQTLNSMKAIWRRPENEVTPEEYNEFYKHVSHDWNEPLEKILYKAEGTTEFRALLFLPAHAPFDMFMRDGQHGIDLYIQRVFIMKDCKELIPEYLRFIRGVVDSEDLSLNISRELLQQNRQIKLIRASLLAKILAVLADLCARDKQKYQTFWNEFGRVIKEGIFQDAKNREKILSIALFRSTHAGDEWTSLEEYIARMKEDQDAIYYITGESLKALQNSPHLEAFREKAYEVLLLTEPVDEIWVQSVYEHKDKKLRSVGKGEVELGSDDERKKAEEERKEKSREFQPLLDALKNALDEDIKEVRLSARLTTSPACLVSDEMDLTPQLEQLLRASGQDMPKTKRILEINPAHNVISRLRAICALNPNDDRIGQYAPLLYGQALLAEGGKLPETGNFTKNLAQIMEKALG